MKKKSLLGISLIIVSIILFVTNRLFISTGAVIGSSSQIYLGVVTIIIFILGLSLVLRAEAESGLEREVKKPAPGKGIKGSYIPLREIIQKRQLHSNKVVVELRDNTIYRNNRPVQGLTINGKYAEFVGYHFTSSEAAKIIENDKALKIKNFLDPYIYFLEPLDYSKQTGQAIRHMVGASAAKESVALKVRYPIEKVYLKFEKGRPTHFAIDGDIEPSDIIKRKGKYIERKKFPN